MSHPLDWKEMKGILYEVRINCRLPNAFGMMIQPSYLSMELGYRSWTGRSRFPDDDERLRTPDTERG